MEQPGNDGLLLFDASKAIPRVGVWIMPDNTIPGILEDFVQHLISDDDLLRDYSRQCIEHPS